MTAPVREKRGRLAEAMPAISAWVSELRNAFGDDLMDDLIVRGRRGEPVFYASENGHSFGTKSSNNANVWRGEGLADRHFCGGCDGTCVGTNRRCGHVSSGQAT
jgi:hypothetical protein